MLERIPLGRIGAVDEVAGAVAYLISDEAGYMTAQTLHINGGMYAA
jgi:3-oxoacyl-[acyl-carrier protein] reductase